MTSPDQELVCSLCGQKHQPIPLAAGEKAFCSRCGHLLQRCSRFGRDSTLAIVVTGLVLALPAYYLPFISTGKFGMERGGLLVSGIEGLWIHDMRLLAVWVALCGVAAPLLLLLLLATVLSPVSRKIAYRGQRILVRIAHALSYWAMPEVHVLAVLVALIKLGSLVDVSIGLGFWAYAGMSACVLIAWRGFTLRPPATRMA
ncbi:MAG: paraquat-inducible protein A [Nibricoccus sp.]